MAKKGNPFQIEGNIKKSGNIFTGTFCLIQKNELPTKAQFGKEPELIIGDEDDGGLGHYTSFMYDSTNDVIAIQTNCNGVSANGLAAYFRRNYKVKDITLEIIINPDKLEQLLKMTTISSFQVSIARPENAAFVNPDNKKAFSEMNAIADNTDANILTLQLGIGYKRDATLKKQSIFSYVRNLLSKNQNLDVRKIEIKGKEHEEDNLDNNNTRRMRFVRDMGGFSRLMTYLRIAIFSNLTLLAASFLVKYIEHRTGFDLLTVKGCNIPDYLFVFIFIFSILTSLRFTHIFISLLTDKTISDK